MILIEIEKPPNVLYLFRNRGNRFVCCIPRSLDFVVRKAHPHRLYVGLPHHSAEKFRELGLARLKALFHPGVKAINSPGSLLSRHAMHVRP